MINLLVRPLLMAQISMEERVILAVLTVFNAASASNVGAEARKLLAGIRKKYTSLLYRLLVHKATLERAASPHDWATSRIGGFHIMLSSITVSKTGGVC